MDEQDFNFQESRLSTQAEAILTVLCEAFTTEVDNVKQTQYVQRLPLRNGHCDGTILTTTDASLPDISGHDILQSATESAHSNYVEALDNHTVLAGVLMQPTDESQ